MTGVEDEIGAETDVGAWQLGTEAGDDEYGVKNKSSVCRRCELFEDSQSITWDLKLPSS